MQKWDTALPSSFNQLQKRWYYLQYLDALISLLIYKLPHLFFFLVDVVVFDCCVSDNASWTPQNIYMYILALFVKRTIIITFSCFRFIQVSRTNQLTLWLKSISFFEPIDLVSEHVLHLFLKNNHHNLVRTAISFLGPINFLSDSVRSRILCQWTMNNEHRLVIVCCPSSYEQYPVFLKQSKPQYTRCSINLL